MVQYEDVVKAGFKYECTLFKCGMCGRLLMFGIVENTNCYVCTKCKTIKFYA